MTTAGQPTGQFNQTLAVEFTVEGDLDGVTVGPALQGPPVGRTLDPQQLYRADVDDLGLINPDYFEEDADEAPLGTYGNRLITYFWIEGQNVGDADASVDVVDAVDGTPVVQENIGTFVGSTTFYRKAIFVPQGSMLRVRGMSGSLADPIKVRYNVEYLNTPIAVARALQAVSQIESPDRLLTGPYVDIPGGGTIPTYGFARITGTPVTIPLAADSNGPIYVKNTTAGNVTFNPSGADTVDGGAAFILGAGNSTVLKSEGVSAWETF
jgi:hypothetical protein